jgi:hypothetical protein
MAEKKCQQKARRLMFFEWNIWNMKYEMLKTCLRPLHQCNRTLFYRKSPNLTRNLINNFELSVQKINTFIIITTTTKHLIHCTNTFLAWTVALFDIIQTNHIVPATLSRTLIKILSTESFHNNYRTVLLFFSSFYIHIHLKTKFI